MKKFYPGIIFRSIRNSKNYYLINKYEDKKYKGYNLITRKDISIDRVDMRYYKNILDLSQLYKSFYSETKYAEQSLCINVTEDDLLDTKKKSNSNIKIKNVELILKKVLTNKGFRGIQIRDGFFRYIIDNQEYFCSLSERVTAMCKLQGSDLKPFRFFIRINSFLLARIMAVKILDKK